MIPFDVYVFPATTAGSRTEEILQRLRALEARLAVKGRSPADVLSLTFFVSPGDRSGFRAQREQVLALVTGMGGPVPPATTVVAQAPEGPGRIALEASVCAAPGARVERCAAGDVVYARARLGRIRQVHVAGVGAGASAADTDACATEAFGAMRAVLAREGMDFGNVVRQWGYIEGLLEVQADCPRGHQRYQAFNDVRSLAYATSRFPDGYPAATGIGQSAGGVTLECIALAAPRSVRIAPVSNPRQTDAHRYSGQSLVGEPLRRLSAKSPPKFERAKEVRTERGGTIFVSGTASILGEATVGIGDVAAQTRTTIDNIGALVGGRGLSRLRAYVRHAEDMPVVRRLCEEAYGPIPALYVQADVCRDDLLVEIEGVVRIAEPTTRSLVAAGTEPR